MTAPEIVREGEVFVGLNELCNAPSELLASDIVVTLSNILSARLGTVVHVRAAFEDVARHGWTVARMQIQTPW